MTIVQLFSTISLIRLPYLHLSYLVFKSELFDRPFVLNVFDRSPLRCSGAIETACHWVPSRYHPSFFAFSVFLAFHSHSQASSASFWCPSVSVASGQALHIHPEAPSKIPEATLTLACIPDLTLVISQSDPFTFVLKSGYSEYLRLLKISGYL